MIYLSINFRTNNLDLDAFKKKIEVMSEIPKKIRSFVYYWKFPKYADGSVRNPSIVKWVYEPIHIFHGSEHMHDIINFRVMSI